MRTIGQSALLALLLAGCVAGPGPGTGAVDTLRRPVAERPPVDGAGPDSILGVVAQIEQVAEYECRARTTRVSCDYNIGLDDNPKAPANAFQTVDERGRPVIILTAALIRQMRNPDELAFVLGHEAAHHIAGHLPRKQGDALTGAMVLGTLAVLGGADADVIRDAQGLGAELGARRYSKNYELEADALGAIIAYRAGYDPERGAAYFTRIPDPGDQFLGTHPPNADRMRVVRETMAGL